MELFWLTLLQVCVITVKVALAASEKSTLHVLAGQDALLNCVLEGYDRFPLESKILDVLWKANGKTVVSVTPAETKVYREEAYITGDTLNGNMSLLLKNASFTDEGKYTCEIFNSTNLKVERQVELYVSGRPSVLVFSPKTLEVGKESGLVCDVVGYYPQPIFVKWYRRKHGNDVELSKNECLMSPVRLPNGTFSVSLQITIHATSDDVGVKFICAVEHQSFFNLGGRKSVEAALTVKEPENQGTGVAIPILLSIFFTCLVGAIILFMYDKSVPEVPPVLSEITAAKPIIHKEKCELKIAVIGFKPDYIEVSWILRCSGSETVIGYWKPSMIPFVCRRKMRNTQSSQKEDWSTETSSISRNDDGTFRLSSSVIFLPDIDRDIDTTIICSVSHKAVQEPQTETFLVEEVNHVPPKISHIIAPPFMMDNQVGTLTCPISSFKPQNLRVTWLKLVKDDAGEIFRKIISQFEGDVQEANKNMVVHNENFAHTLTVLQLPEQKCSVYSMLAFRPAVSDDDNAEYACEITHMKLSPELRTTSLKIRACPIADPIVCNEPPKFPVAGKPFKLECRIHSFYPEPVTIHWLKDGVPLLRLSDDTDERKGPDEHKLYEVKTLCTIIPTLQDEGKKIVCKADHETLSVKSEFTLCRIASSPEVSDIQCRPLQPVLGKECVLSCQISNFRPQVIHFTWYKIDSKAEYKLRKGDETESKCDKEDGNDRSISPELHLTPAMDDLNSEIRIEVLHASLTSPLIKSYFLHFPGMSALSQIKLDPETPEYGNMLSMHCRVDGLITKDQITSEWLLQDKKEITDLRNFQVKPTVKQDAGGNYYMESSIQFHVDASHFEKEFIFRVHDKKNNHTFTRRMVLPLQYMVPKISDITCDTSRPVRGQKITLSCTAYDFSPGEIRFIWSKDLEESKTYPGKERKMNNKGLFSAVSKFCDVCKEEKMEITYTCGIHHIKTDTIAETKKTIRFS